MWRLAKITVYRGSVKWEYETFCTPEAYNTIKKYWKYRETAGEVLTDESPAFRKDFSTIPITHKVWHYAKRVNPDFRNKYIPEGAIGAYISADVLEKRRIDDIKHPEPLRFWSIQQYVDKRCLDLKIAGRKITHKTESNGHAKIQYKVQTIHGFRKFTQTSMSAAGVNRDVSDLLIGHTLPGVRGHYQKWPLWMKLVEYWKAKPDLTIDKSDELKAQVQDVKAKAHHMEVRAFQQASLDLGKHKEDMGQMKHDYEEYMKQMKHEHDEEMARLRFEMDSMRQSQMAYHKANIESSKSALDPSRDYKEIHAIEDKPELLPFAG